MPSLTQLGQRSEIPSSPDIAVLETIDWLPRQYGGFSESRSVVRLTCPEFTSLCPVTGAPDFARITIDYTPDKKLVESKSLKLFLHSFRNHGAFHEAVVDMIGDRFFQAVEPLWIRVVGLFYPRGGIPIDVFWTKGKLPVGIAAPDLPSDFYRGR